MKLVYFGHSAFQLETSGATLLVDPWITGNPRAEGVVSPDELNPDVIFLTHAHGDHLGDAPEIATRSGALVVSNFEITSYFSREHGHDHVLAMNTGGAWTFDWGKVHQTYARHSSSFPDGGYGGNPNGFVFEVEGKSVYAAGDTCAFAEMEWIGDDFEPDLALLPIGDCFTSGIRDAVRAAGLLRPDLTVPVHYNTFPPIEVDVSQWEQLMEEAGFATRVLEPGGVLEI